MNRANGGCAAPGFVRDVRHVAEGGGGGQARAMPLAGKVNTGKNDAERSERKMISCG
jgi:hypothetical protein